jgi:plastocyanin
MEGQNKNIIWIAGGIIVAAAVVYLVTSGGTLPGTTPEIEGVKTEQGTVVVPGTDAISEEGVVVNQEGVEVKSDAAYGSAEAPKQSALVDKEALPDSVVKVEQIEGGFSPSEFTVKAGRGVVLSVTGGSGCSFRFMDPALNAVGMGVGPGETRVVPFNAPEKEGEYKFFCDVPGYESRGWIGKMIVE